MAKTVLRRADGFPGERLTVLPPAVIRAARSLPVCRDLCVTHTGRFDHVRGHYMARPRGLPDHVFMMCLAGEGQVRLGRVTYRLHRGHGMVLPPRRPHQYAADMDNPWSLFWFHFRGRRAGDFVNAVGAGPASPRFWVEDIDVLAEAFEECYRHVLGGYSDAELIGLSTSFARLLGLCRTLQRSPSLRRRRTEDRMLRTLRFMRENRHRLMTLREMASHARLSPPHFGAMFKRQMNCSPLEFHIRLRMQAACELLETTQRTVAEIAYALGYDDPLYFSRLFRQKVGRPPTSYREGNARG